jgi:hypothetical protein
MKRRDFVRNLFVSVAALVVSPYLRSFGALQSAALGREGWSGAAFEREFGSSFRVRGPEGVQHLVMDQVAHGRHKNVETASLRFRGSARSRLAEASYPFAHPDLGQMSLFIVPGTTDGADCFYRATLVRFV